MAASIVLTASFRGHVLGVARLEIDHLEWIPYDMGTTIEKDALPREVLRLSIHTDKGTADLHLADARPLHAVWKSDPSD